LGCAKIRDGEDWALIGHGVTVHLMLQARERASELGLPMPAVVDLRRLKPLDTDAVDQVLENYPTVLVAEEDYLHGGVGELIAARLAEKNCMTVLKRLGVPDRFIQHATIDQQREFCGLTVDDVLKCALGSVRPRAQTA
jgi:1-deoxy-D-xylulose-5-phosphate synthase